MCSQCLQVLRGSRAARADIRNFLCTQLAFWLLAATDGNAKNFSIFLLPGGEYRMTPLYDVISLWPVIGNADNHVTWQKAKLAMAVRSKNVHCELARIQTRHWKMLALRSVVESVWEAMQVMMNGVEPAITALRERLASGYPTPTADAVFAGMTRQSAVWRAGLQRLD